MRRFCCLLCLLFCVACQALEREPVVVVNAAGMRHVFASEIANTDEQRRVGLMFRRSMDSRHAMLFDFMEVAKVTMWMVNTFIPLDMLFIDGSGRIVHIAHRTQPLSRELIRSEVPARAVLEINAGLAETLNIAPGDRVDHAIFGRSANAGQAALPASVSLERVETLSEATQR